MFKSIRRQTLSLDLETLRATVGYMQDDAGRTPGYERLAAALGAVLREIDATERARPPRASSDVVAARFLPFRR